MKKELLVKGEIILYSSAPKGSQVEVRLEGESIWLTQAQMAEVFGVSADSIGVHLRNIYASKELNKKPTTEVFSVVRLEGKRQTKRTLTHYNLDAIISIGYRVNSKKGTQFRIWANKILKGYLLKGYAINEEKLKRQEDKIRDLQKAVSLIANVSSKKELISDEAASLIKILQDYTYGLDILDQYDHGKLEISNVSKKKGFRLDYGKGIAVIGSLKNKFGGSDLFGKEKDQSFKSSIETIYQTFDGNKRIAAFIFLWFLEKNKILYKGDGTKVLENNALVALTLMIAESRPQEKEIIVKVIVNLINKRN